MLLRAEVLSKQCCQISLRMTILVMAVFLSACGSRPSSGPESNLRQVVLNQHQQVVKPTPAVLEGREIKAQHTPRHRALREPDDPIEPFSPNYGSIDPELAGKVRDAEPWILPSN